MAGPARHVAPVAGPARHRARVVGPRRLRALAGCGFVALLLAASGLQLRPFAWDTYRVSRSLVAFDRHRVPLMGGACLRAGLLFACVALACALPRRPAGAGGPLARGGVMLLVAGGLLSAAAGAVGMVLGVPAEEYHPGMVDAKAVEVLADALYWVQDDLVMVANLALAAGAGALALALRPHGVPAWATRAGLLAFPLAAAAALSFVCITADLGQQPWWYVAWYAGAMAAAVAALSAWALGVTVAAPGPDRDRRGAAAAGRRGPGGERPGITAAPAAGGAPAGGPAGTGSPPLAASR